MAFKQISSPHAHASQNTAKVMQLVLWATIPGLIALTIHFGWGSLINLVLATVTAVIAEALIIKLRGRPVAFYLKDYSAVLTAVLLGLALPPLAPWWVVVVGTLFSIVIAKQLYGGLGYNPFNPAMVGYVVLLISFPIQMTTWVTPAALLPEGISHPGLIESVQIVFSGLNPADGVTGATPLDSFKYADGLLVDQIYAQNPLFSQAAFAGVGWEWVNIAFLAGGVWLIYRGIFTWHAPLAMLITLGLCAAIGFDSGSSESGGSPLFHWLSGATMFGAFFIITDPVSGATSNRGRLIFGALVGVLLYLIRVAGNYPDALAFAVLILNFAAPFIDQYTQPVTYGHKPTKEDDE